ncbi:MAG: hypothetical protein WB507_03350 [Solirubrobacterales bacterium]
MSFNLLAVRELGAHPDPLYPDPAEQADSIELGEGDGQASAPLLVNELVVHEIPPGGLPKRLLRLPDITAALRTTDKRITVACSKYDKGGGWAPWTPGAIPVALAANAVSKARASKRRVGKMLVGEVPYQGLVSVGFKPRSTPLGRDQLRFGSFDPTIKTFRGLLLDVSLPRDHAGADIARLIVAHAATRRLLSGDDALDDKAREHLRSLQTPAPLQGQPKEFASYFIIPADDAKLRAAYQKG